MNQPLLAPGDLIRYEATTTRWHLGVVREVDNESVEAESFWGDCQRVPLEQVTKFRDYLDSRQRTLSLKRTALCEAFFGDPLYRLREERLRKIQTTLQSHGLAFYPKDWPTPDSRVQIWRDDSVVFKNRADKDTKLEALLPRWLEPLKLPTSSRDPLGLQAHAERLANELLPGLTVFTNRIGYYGFLAWAIQFINNSPCPSGLTRQECLYRLERALALCEFVYHGAGDDSCPLLGQRSKTQVLQSAEADRFRVPKRILKNQASAGAYRLYFTSLNSFGFTQEATDLGSEGLLPLAITDLGNRLVRAIDHRLDSKFARFALSNDSLERDTIRSWGKRLCFSELHRQGRYREPLLEGFLLGNSPDAEKRFRTVERLFERGLLTGSFEKPTNESTAEVLAEEDARAAEEIPAVAGLGNDTVLLNFYEEPPQDDNQDFQAGAVFELVSLGLSALFQAIVEELWKVGRTKPVQLGASIAEDQQVGHLWSSPLTTSVTRTPKARKIVQQLLASADPMRRASLGGVLLARLVRDRPQRAVADDLAANPALMLCHQVLWSQPERSLAQVFPDLVAAMLDRHQTVSMNKNRRRWCYLDGDIVVMSCKSTP
jgi:hypothetical protein